MTATIATIETPTDGSDVPADPATAVVPPKRPRAAKAAASDAPTPAALRVTVAQDALDAALSLVSRQAGTGAHIVPVASHVLLDATDTSLRLVCTDFEAFLAVTLPASERCVIHAPGRFTVPAKTLAALAGTFGAQPVTLAHEGAVLRVQCGSARSQLKGIDAEQFPDTTEHPAPSFTLPAGLLRRHLALTVWAAAQDETRPVLATVHLRGVPWQQNAAAHAGPLLAAEAANGFALAMRQTEVPMLAPDALPAFSALVPRKAAQTLAHLLDGSGPDDEVTVALVPDAERPRMLRVTLAGAVDTVDEARTVTLCARLSEGQFPDLERVVPKDCATRITVGRAALLALVKQAAILAARDQDAYTIIRFAAESAGVLRVGALDPERGEHTAEVPAEVLGPGVRFALSAGYVLSFLGALPGDTVTLELGGPLSPVLLRDTALPDYRVVVMPMHVPGWSGTEAEDEATTTGGEA